MSSQAVKYQETQVPATRSVAEITELIRKYGGSRFEQTWGEDGRILGVRFAMRHREIGELPVALTLKTGQVERILSESPYLRSLPESNRAARIAQQAERVAWRHMKDLIEQLLLSVALGLRSLPAAFHGRHRDLRRASRRDRHAIRALRAPGGAFRFGERN